jgi:hypothetical protein
MKEPVWKTKVKILKFKCQGAYHIRKNYKLKRVFLQHVEQLRDNSSVGTVKYVTG